MTLLDRPVGDPGGRYEMTWEGTGELWLSQVDVVEWGTNRVVVDFDPRTRDYGRHLFTLASTDENDPFRNLKILPAGGSVNAAPAAAFRPAFLDRWSGMGAFRYMDWGQTNNSKVSSWGDRALPTDATQASPKGVALELQVDHANATRTNPWFNIPHLADDDYVRQAATLIRDRLDDGLAARVEFSNEVWNDVFDQAKHGLVEGEKIVAEGPRNRYQDRLRWYSERSVEVFGIFEDVFTDGGRDAAGMDRLVRVMGAQAASAWSGGQLLGWKNAYEHVDALAIAPYFGRTIQYGTDADAWRNATQTERVALVEEGLQEAFGWMESYADLLALGEEDGDRPYGDIDLFAYEGGQHLVPAEGLRSDRAFVDLVSELSRMDEMEDFYARYLAKWEELGGEDMMLFSSMSPYDKTGNWGLLESEAQPLEDSAKMRGVLRYLAERGNPVPEPAALSLALLGGPLLLRRRRAA